MIGFKDTNNAIAKFEEDSVIDFIDTESADILMRARALQLVQQSVSEYMSATSYPFITGKDRDEWLTEKLSKIRQRYLEPI